MSDNEILAVTITQATEILGVGRTSLYAAIAKGTLSTKKLGRRTLIEMNTLRRFLEDLPNSKNKTPADRNGK